MSVYCVAVHFHHIICVSVARLCLSIHAYASVVYVCTWYVRACVLLCIHVSSVLCMHVCMHMSVCVNICTCLSTLCTYACMCRTAWSLCTVWRDGSVAVCASQYNGHTVCVQCAYYLWNLLATFKCLTLTASRATNTERVMLTINRAATVTPSTADVITREPSRTESAVDQRFNIPPLCGGREAFQREEGEWGI